MCFLEGNVRLLSETFLKRGAHLEFNAIEMLKKITLALLTQVET